MEGELRAVLFDIAREVMTHLDMDSALTHLCDHAYDLLDSDRVLLALIENGNLVNFTTDTNSPQTSSEPLKIAWQSGQSLARKAYLTRQVQSTANYFEDPLFEHDPKLDSQVRQDGFPAVLACPIFWKSEVLGIMWVTKQKAYHWTETDQTGVVEFASLAALVITNARLYRQLEIVNNELDGRNREISFRNQELEMLHKFNERLRGPVEVEAAARRALDLATEVVGAEAGMLHLWDAHSPDELHLIADLDELQLSPELAQKVSLGSGPIGQVAENGETLFIEDANETYWNKILVSVNSSRDWHSGMFAALKSDGAITGVISLLARSPYHFDQKQLRFLEVLSRQIAVALRQVSKIENWKEREQLTALQTLARTAAHELNQHLAVLMIGLSSAFQQDQHLDTETLEMMQEAVAEISERIKQYQKIASFQTVEAVPGFKILDRQKSILDNPS